MDEPVMLRPAEGKWISVAATLVALALLLAVAHPRANYGKLQQKQAYLFSFFLSFSLKVTGTGPPGVASLPIDFHLGTSFPPGPGNSTCMKRRQLQPFGPHIFSLL